jgi:hypothetical protein
MKISTVFHAILPPEIKRDVTLIALIIPLTQAMIVSRATILVMNALASLNKIAMSARIRLNM